MHLMDSAGIFGAEVMLLNLVSAQRSKGMDARIGSIQTPGDVAADSNALTTYARRLGIPVDPVPMAARSLSRGMLALKRFAGEHTADVIHSHGYKANILLATLNFFIKLPPLVTTIHGWTAIDTNSRIGIYEKVDQWLLRHFDRIVVVTPDQLKHQRIVRLGKLSHVECVENGTDPNWRDQLKISEPEQRTLQELQEFVAGNKLILAVGRLSCEKAHNSLISAFANLTKQDASLRLVIAGEGPARPDLEQQISELNLGAQVRLPGYLERIDILLDQADCLAQPSLTEGLPITLLEAMARNIPIVATRVGGVARLLGNGIAGYIIERDDISALESGITSAFRDTAETARRTTVARQLFAESYSAEHMADQYQRIYQDCMGQSQPHSSHHQSRING